MSLSDLRDRLDERFRLSERWATVRPYLPFIAFGCGFLFDSVTLGRRVSRLDLYLVSAYGILAFIALAIRELELTDRLRRVVSFALQFCLGGSLSALVVLYFRSTGHLFTLLFVLALFVSMVVNELLHADEEPPRDYVWAIWVVSATMLANFVVPHIVGSVSAVWFYLSAAVALGLLLLVRWLAKVPWRSMRLTIGAALGLVLFWVLGFIPPVPLVYKNNLVCTDFIKAEYSCRVDDPGWKQKLGVAPTTVTGRPVYCLTAVFAPLGVDVEVKHHWYREVDGEWEQTDDMSFEMRGGRKEGWRFWSRKRNAQPGIWKVETALSGGAVLGYEKFEVREASDDVSKHRQKL